MAGKYDPTSDHYTALGVAAAAPHDDIKKAHRSLISKLHPDRGGDAASAAQVNIARDVLLDAVTRAEYDEARRDWHDHHPFVGIFTEAGHQLYRERKQAPPRSAAAEQAAPRAPARWRSQVAKSIVLDQLALAIVSGNWLEAVGILGSAFILDHVIESRVGGDLERRASLDSLAKSIQLQHAKEFVQALSTELERRQDHARVAARRVGPKKVRSAGSREPRTSRRSALQ